jgi:hypothetical protein
MCVIFEKKVQKKKSDAWCVSLILLCVKAQLAC